MNSNPSLEDKGVYVLVIKLNQSITLKPGKLPSSRFLPGTYLYVGRAQKGLLSRIRRHFRREKKLFWHIDYLLQKARLENAWIKPGDEDECGTVARIKEYTGEATYPVKKFGSSDCGCPSHLLYLSPAFNLDGLQNSLCFPKVFYGN